MTLESLYEQLQQQFSDRQILRIELASKDPWIEVAPEAIHAVCLYLRDHEKLQFDTLSNLTAVDYLERDPKKKDPVSPHLEVVYHLYSLPRKTAAKLKVLLPRWEGDVVGQLPRLASVADIWKIADWHEREAFDLVGVEFIGHPDLRRILCPEDWLGHPLRKDYEFPLEYEGIRGR